MGQMGMGGGGGSGAPGAGAAPAKEAEKPKEAPKVEKTHFDVELTKFDAAGKIKVIKEIRALLNLSLKEAKDLVKTAPCWISKELKKEDCKAMIAKLKEAGPECRMV